MANYKRVISYMYAYRNQLKGNNVGFARIETRGNECKITLHIRVVNMKDQEVGGYIYCWYEGKLHAVYLGDIHISNGVGELVVKTDVDNIMNSKYRFTDMGGILLYVSEAQYIATEWDGKAVLFDTLKIDTVKPEEFAQLRSSKQEESSIKKEESVAAAEAHSSDSFSAPKKQEAEIETAVAMVIPEQEQSEKEEEEKTSEMESSLDEMIEDEVAKEELEEERAVEEAVEENEETPQATPQENRQENQEEDQQEKKESNSMWQRPQRTEPEINEQPEQKEERQEDERPGSFPLSREKMEHLDKEAQELFGTMLLNTLFPPEKSAENRKEEKEEETFNPLSEEPQMPEEKQEQKVKEQTDEEKEQVEERPSVEPEPETVQANETLTVSPKTAIQCFTAFRNCESAGEYEEIQEEIQTMKQEIKQLEHISEEWKIKEARLKEIQREKEEMEKEQEREQQKHQIEEQIRSEYNIDGIKSELQAAEIKRAVTERIFNKYPRIAPFEDVSVEDCVRIEPQDLGIFPMENWILANNSFLLHGYYSYRHLIFVMENVDGKEHYLLGVPGVNHSRERFMANMFGFDIFKNLSSKEDESGEFGYWCHEIIM